MPKNLAVKLSSQGEKIVKKGHPWIFSDSVIKTSSNPKTGDVAVIFGKTKNKVIALGLYDADSPIAIKIIYNGNEKVIIDASFFERRILEAFQKRIPLIQTETDGFRLIFGENDGFPGLIVDVYGNVAVVKLYSGIWVPYFQSIINAILKITVVATIVIRLSRSLISHPNFKFTDGQVVYGELRDPNVRFKEFGVNFLANVIKGHKTGFFLDHRQNRRLVGELSKGKTVLDVFSYAGGFSVHALTNGATEVASLDISQKALEVAKINANLNDFKGIHEIMCGDAFLLLNRLIENKKKFDVVVIDPPSFAKRKSEVKMAKRKYRQLAELGTKLTASNGLLVLASCSSRVLSQSFYDINKQALDSCSRPYRLIHKTAHDIDHPITFLEAAYLKTGFYRFSDTS